MANCSSQPCWADNHLSGAHGNQVESKPRRKHLRVCDSGYLAIRMQNDLICASPTPRASIADTGDCCFKVFWPTAPHRTDHTLYICLSMLPRLLFNPSTDSHSTTNRCHICIQPLVLFRDLSQSMATPCIRVNKMIGLTRDLRYLVLFQ
jgi:hypothetical protein